MAYGDFVIQHDLNFTIYNGEIFIIMGGSGCGKSTLLRALVGLQAPAKGECCTPMKTSGVPTKSGAMRSSEKPG